MKKLLWSIIFLFSFTNIKSADVLSKERVSDLLIFNDVSELLYDWDLVSNIEYSDQGIIIQELVAGLLENQSIIATKSLWASVQNVIQVWNNYNILSVDELQKKYSEGLNDYYKYAENGPDKNNGDGAEKNNDELKDSIKFYTDIITKAQEHYEQIQKYIKEDSSQILPYLKDISQQDNYSEITNIFAFYCCYQAILSKGYICKEVNDQFILFIPKNLVLDSDKDLEKDLFLGLSYTKLKDFDYRKKLSEDDIAKIFTSAKNINANISLGQNLLDALMTLKIDKSDLSRLKNAQLPFFNLFIDGHGDYTCTSEISITLSKDPRTKEQTSDMLKILKFFSNSMRIKSLIFLSCYPGGKKFMDTFDIKHPLSNASLESIGYPLLFVGSFYAVTTTKLNPGIPFEETDFSIEDSSFYISKQIKKGLFFKKYFDVINQDPIEYKKATDQLIFGYTENLASFKKPNTAWFIPVEFESKKSEQKNFIAIPQIYALTHKKIVISSSFDLTRIWLKANYIDTLEFPKRYFPLVEDTEIESTSQEESNIILGFPGFLPLSYENQNYLIEKIEAPDLILNDRTSKLDSSLYSLMEIFFEVYENEEPINFVIKEIKAKNAHFKNVYVFRYKPFTEDDIINYKDGYIYTDTKTGKTKIVSWLYNEETPFKEKEYQEKLEIYKKDNPDETLEKIQELMKYEGIVQFEEKDFDVKEAMAWIDEVEKKAKKDLTQYGDYQKIEKLYEQEKQRNKKITDVHTVARVLDLAFNVNESLVIKDQRVSRILDLALAVNRQKETLRRDMSVGYLKKQQKNDIRVVGRSLALVRAVNRIK